MIEFFQRFHRANVSHNFLLAIMNKSGNSHNRPYTAVQQVRTVLTIFILNLMNRVFFALNLKNYPKFAHLQQIIMEVKTLNNIDLSKRSGYSSNEHA